jgi:hypothetical protein
MRRTGLAVIVALLSASAFSSAQIPYPGKSPGMANIKSDENHIVLENDVLRMELRHDGKSITMLEFQDKESGERLRTGHAPLFEVIMRGNRVVTSDDFTIPKPPAVSEIKGDPDSPVYAARLSGKKYSADLENRKEGVSLHWEAEICIL